MPLHPNGENRIRRNLQAVKAGNRPQRARIGYLTDVQLNSINAHRRANLLPEIAAEITFLGKHVYESRCVQNGYSIEEVILQITRALDETSIFRPVRSWTTLRNPEPRVEKGGNRVHDEVVLECTSQAPYPELFSVVPRGDGREKLEKAPKGLFYKR